MRSLGTRSARRRLALLVIASSLLAALLVVPTTAAAPGETGDPRADRARQALARVQAIRSGQPNQRAALGTHPRRASLTMELRDLQLHKDALTGRDRDEADRLLARPTGGKAETGVERSYQHAKRICSKVLCVHYEQSGEHRATRRYARAVRRAATTAHRKYRKWGFRRPLRDPGSKEFGGDSRPDIYLVDLNKNLYGYAAPEGHWPRGGEDAKFGYAVVDRDFKTQCQAWYSNCTAKWRRKLMRVTVAHEYFHLVQFGYDYGEDRWFMEATATWIEDEVFDGVNDNVGFLWGRPSAMRTPAVPLDVPEPAAYYGNWIFFRHLSERFGRRVVRKAWNRADAWLGHRGHRSPKDQHSQQAIRGAVEAVGGRWNREFARFAEANRRPQRYYDEAKALPYPSAPRKPRGGALTHSKGNRKITVGSRFSHLSSRTYRFKPARELRRGWKLRVRIDGDPHWRGGYAVAMIKKRGGGLKRVNFYLGSNGTKKRTLRYGTSKVRWIEVTVVNASTRYHCEQRLLLDTCRREPLDDDRRYRILTRAVR